MSLEDSHQMSTFTTIDILLKRRYTSDESSSNYLLTESKGKLLAKHLTAYFSLNDKLRKYNEDS